MSKKKRTKGCNMPLIIPVSAFKDSSNFKFDGVGGVIKCEAIKFNKKDAGINAKMNLYIKFLKKYLKKRN